MKKVLLSLIFCLYAVSLFAQPDTVNTGTAPNSGNGDNIRNAFTKVNTNDQFLYGQYQDAITVVQVLITDTLAVATGETGYILAIGDALNGKNLIKVEAYWGDSQGTAVPTITVWRNRGGTEVSMTSSGATFTLDAVVNQSNDDVLASDRLELRWGLGSGTPPYGLIVHLSFQRP